MSIKTERKKRRIPVLCIIFILIAVLIHTVITPVYSIIGAVVYAITRFHGLLSINAYLGINPILSSLLGIPIYAFEYASLNVIFFSILFLFIIAIMLLCKIKGGFVAIPAFLASLFTAGCGIFNALFLLLYLLVGAASGPTNQPIRNIFLQLATLIHSPSRISFSITLLLQFAISFFWFVLALAAIFSIFSRKAKKKTFKLLFGVPTLILGVWSGGIFITAILTNVLSILLDLNDIIYDNIYLSFSIRIISYFTLCFCALIFILANILGLAGIILLAFYLVNPYKRKKKLALEAPLETAEAGTEESCDVCEAEVLAEAAADAEGEAEPMTETATEGEAAPELETVESDIS